MLAAVAAAAALVAPVDALAKPQGRLRPAVLTQYLNWGGDCGGGGFLSRQHTPNPDSCALYYHLRTTNSFGGSEGFPILLDARRPVVVDFSMFTIATAAADFDVILSGTVGGKQVEIGSATHSVTASALGYTSVRLELQPPAELDLAKVTALNLEVSWRTNGFTISEMDLDSGFSKLVVRGFK